MRILKHHGGRLTNVEMSKKDIIPTISDIRKKANFDKKTPEQKERIYNQMIALNLQKRENFLKNILVEHDNELMTAYDANIKSIANKKKYTYIEYRNIFFFDYEHEKAKYEVLMDLVYKYKIEFTANNYKESNIVEILIPRLSEKTRKKIEFKKTRYSKRFQKSIRKQRIKSILKEV